MKLISTSYKLSTKNGWLSVDAKKEKQGMTLSFRAKKCPLGMHYEYPNLHTISPTRIKQMIESDKELSDVLGLEYLYENYMKRESKRMEIPTISHKEFQEENKRKNEEFKDFINKLNGR